ncbi:MAG TPA: 1,4-alpha-glucan branching protein domain-containing protein [Thermomicrobiales bacterium]|nr:1,4-alpha-glucan branching protein domain-containing protein [Thermomicrobiales bacterium]
MTTSTTGAFTFVLHSHLPYARMAGMWPHGEEWVHEAIAETYLPLLRAFDELSEEGVPWSLTLGITPILGEQLADPLIAANFRTYAAERAAWAAEDVERFDRSGDATMRDLARHAHHWYARSLTDFRDRSGSDLLAGFRRHQTAGNLDISTSAATHGYLPLLSRDSSVHAQLRTGVRAYERRFGQQPTAIWLPECAYRPAQETPDGRRVGIERFLAEERLRVFFSETHTVEGGRPVGKAAGEAIGPYAGQKRYTLVPDAEVYGEGTTTYRPYWVGDALGEVAVLARNNRTGLQVWSAAYGYPGDGAYREFHKKDTASGMRYWGVGGRDVGLGDKPLYNPAVAAERVLSHADHYVRLVEDLLSAYHGATGEPGVISAAYDTELFGHWWFEGVDWLKGVLRGLATSTTVELSTASRIIEQHPPDRLIALPESSWGSNGDHSTWLNDETAWLWPLIHADERRMETLVEANGDAVGDRERLLNQAARELLLLQSSDWPFLITTGQAKEYAIERFTEHHARFERLAGIVERGAPLEGDDLAVLADLEERDNPFPAIDYRDWAPRQGVAPVSPVETSRRA